MSSEVHVFRERMKRMVNSLAYLELDNSNKKKSVPEVSFVSLRIAYSGLYDKKYLKIVL